MKCESVPLWCRRARAVFCSPVASSEAKSREVARSTHLASCRRQGKCRFPSQVRTLVATGVELLGLTRTALRRLLRHFIYLVQFRAVAGPSSPSHSLVRLPCSSALRRLRRGRPKAEVDQQGWFAQQEYGGKDKPLLQVEARPRESFVGHRVCVVCQSCARSGPGSN